MKSLKKVGLFIQEDQDVWLDRQSHDRDGISRSSLARLALAKLIDEAATGLDLDKELAAYGEPQGNGG